MQKTTTKECGSSSLGLGKNEQVRKDYVLIIEVLISMRRGGTTFRMEDSWTVDEGFAL